MALTGMIVIENWLASVFTASFLILLLLLWRWYRSKNSRSRPSIPNWAGRTWPKLRRGHATEKQLNYLRILHEEQNFFRSKGEPFDAWLDRRAPSGLSVHFASELINELKHENYILKKEFADKSAQKEVGHFRGEIFVSDLKSFFFCELAAYFSSHQYPSQNLIDLGRGKKIHDAFSDEESRDSEKPPSVATFIQSKEKGISRVVWLPNAQESTIRHQKLRLSGRPDGVLHFHDGTVAIIELKTVAQIPNEAREGDYRQAETYALILGPGDGVRGEVYVLYKVRGSRDLRLFKRARQMRDGELSGVVSKIERAAKSQTELQPARHANQCRSCGYRSVCLVSKA